MNHYEYRQASDVVKAMQWDGSYDSVPAFRDFVEAATDPGEDFFVVAQVDGTGNIEAIHVRRRGELVAAVGPTDYLVIEDSVDLKVWDQDSFHAWHRKPDPVAAWEADEWGETLIVFGTHDPEAADRALDAMAAEQGADVLDEEPATRTLADRYYYYVRPDWSEAAKRWAHPAVELLSGEWPKELTSRVRQAGWIPFMVVSLS